MNMMIMQLANQIENELRQEKVFISAKYLRRRYPHIPEGIIYNVLAYLSQSGKIERFSNRAWRWK